MDQLLHLTVWPLNLKMSSFQVLVKPPDRYDPILINNFYSFLCLYIITKLYTK